MKYIFLFCFQFDIPMQQVSRQIQFEMISFEKNDISSLMRSMIKKYISNHKLSAIAHEEIVSMAHSDEDIAYFFYEREIEMTKKNICFIYISKLSS